MKLKPHFGLGLFSTVEGADSMPALLIVKREEQFSELNSENAKNSVSTEFIVECCVSSRERF